MTEVEASWVTRSSIGSAVITDGSVLFLYPSRGSLGQLPVFIAGVTRLTTEE